MDIKPPANDLYTAIARSVASSTQANITNTAPPDWKVSQLIQAVITQITDNKLFLNIQGINTNTAKPAIPNLQVGDSLKLQIDQLKPIPQFRIISVQKGAASNIIAEALKNISVQNPQITPLLKNISYVASRPSLRPSPLAADVNATVRELFKQLPSPLNLKTGEQVKEQLQNSGLFVENKLKNHIFNLIQNNSLHKTTNIKTQAESILKTNLDSDLGTQLHRLANLIRTQLVAANDINPAIQNKTNQPNIPTSSKESNQATPRSSTNQASLQTITQREEAMQSFLRQIESSLSHLQQTQLQNLNESQAGRPMWLMEIPIKDGQDIDLFELRINEEETAQSEEETKKIWNVTLMFNLTGLGKIKAHIKMQNEFVSAQFFSEKPQVLSLFQQHFDFLRNRLSYNGLNVGDIECAKANLSVDAPPVNSPSLDERI